MLKKLSKKDWMIIGVFLFVVVYIILQVFVLPDDGSEDDDSNAAQLTQTADESGSGDVTPTEENTPTPTVTKDAENTPTPTKEAKPTKVPTKKPTKAPTKEPVAEPTKVEAKEYTFANNKLWTSHFEKHGQEFPYKTKEDYLAGANKVINNPNSLHKTEKEDGDYVFYLEASNEFVIVSLDGYIRTYFKPSAGINYYNRQ